LFREFEPEKRFQESAKLSVLSVRSAHLFSTIGGPAIAVAQLNNKHLVKERMEKFLDSLNPSVRKWSETLWDQYKKAREKNEKQCVVFVPWQNSADVVETVKKASKILDPGSTISFAQDWDDEDSLRGTMVFSKAR